MAWKGQQGRKTPTIAVTLAILANQQHLGIRKHPNSSTKWPFYCGISTGHRLCASATKISVAIQGSQLPSSSWMLPMGWLDITSPVLFCFRVVPPDLVRSCSHLLIRLELILWFVFAFLLLLTLLASAWFWFSIKTTCIVDLQVK